MGLFDFLKKNKAEPQLTITRFPSGIGKPNKVIPIPSGNIGNLDIPPPPARTLKEQRKTPSELILERYNEILKEDGLPPVSELPSATSDEYKLELLNSKRLSSGMDAVNVLPENLRKTDETTEPPTNDLMNNYKNQLLERINAMELAVAAKSRGQIKNLNVSLANEVYSANILYKEAGGEDFLAEYITQPDKINEFNYMFTSFQKNSSTKDKFDYMKGLVPAATDAQVSVDAEGEIDSAAIAQQLRKEAEDLAKEEAGELTDEEKKQANLIASRRGRSPPFPEIEGLDITDEEIPPDTEGELNLQRRDQRKDPDLFNDYDDEQLRDYRDDLSNQLLNDPDNEAIRDELGSIDREQQNRGEQLAEDLNTERNRGRDPNVEPESESQDIIPVDENIDISPDPDIESTEKTFSGTTDPFIETGKEAKVPDVSIFRSMLHVGTKMSFEFLKQSSGYSDILNIAQQFVPFELQDITNAAANTLQTTRTDDIGSLRTSSDNRMKIHIKDKKHDVVHNPVLYPFLVIALNFYMAKNEGQLIRFNWMVKQGISYVMKSMGLPSNNVDYFLKIYSSYPDSLNQAFMRNKEGVAGIEENEKIQIKSFIEMVISEYNATFTPNKFVKDVRKYEAGGLSLLFILENLGNPQTLFEINKTFETADNFLADVENNKDILLGLMGLIYAEARNEGDMVGAAMINSAMVDGIVYYERTVERQAPKVDIDLELMMQMSEKPSDRRLEGYTTKFNNDKLAEFENQQGDTTILFRGTDFKEKDFMKKDVLQNILNFSGSREIFLNDEYNERYQQAINLVMEKQRMIDNSGEGSIKIQGYSVGGIGAMYLSVLFPELPVKVYNPVISNTDLTKELINELVSRGSNIEFFAVEGDPISANLKNYKDKLNIKYFKKNKFFSSHSLNNYKFI